MEAIYFFKIFIRKFISNTVASLFFLGCISWYPYQKIYFNSFNYFSVILFHFADFWFLFKKRIDIFLKFSGVCTFEVSFRYATAIMLILPNINVSLNTMSKALYNLNHYCIILLNITNFIQINFVSSISIIFFPMLKT